MEKEKFPGDLLTKTKEKMRRDYAPQRPPGSLHAGDLAAPVVVIALDTS